MRKKFIVSFSGFVPVVHVFEGADVILSLRYISHDSAEGRSLYYDPSKNDFCLVFDADIFHNQLGMKCVHSSDIVWFSVDIRRFKETVQNAD